MAPRKEIDTTKGMQNLLPVAAAGQGTYVEEVLGLDAARAFRSLAHLPRVIFLDSALQHGRLGRYSFITGDPFEWLSVTGSGLRPSVDPLAELAARLKRFQQPTLAGLPPFQGGAAGLLGYGLCHGLESIPCPRFDEFGIPDLAVGFYDWVLAFDHLKQRAWLISTGLPETEPGLRVKRARRRLRDIRRLLKAAPVPGHRQPKARLTLAELAPCQPVSDQPRVYSNLSHHEYLDRVARILEYIRAGDCYQVNFSQRLLCPARWPATVLFERLRECSPAPFSAFMDGGEFAIGSVSPERFLRLQRGRVEARPIKGTRPRGQNDTEDGRLIAELLASGKDRAENVMIVDLLRNDLGRVCRYGSVRVPEVCRVETYPHVHHLVSVIRGRLRSDVTASDLLRAAFPGGSVTGAPKVRAMEIISELEPTARGPYCGSLGYISFDGAMDMSVLIRTFTMAGGWVQFPAGGGIVADSNPEEEYRETWVKASGFLGSLVP
jgi:para-aminobenzoate synthetase component 1